MEKYSFSSLALFNCSRRATFSSLSSLIRVANSFFSANSIRTRSSVSVFRRDSVSKSPMAFEFSDCRRTVLTTASSSSARDLFSSNFKFSAVASCSLIFSRRPLRSDLNFCSILSRKFARSSKISSSFILLHNCSIKSSSTSVIFSLVFITSGGACFKIAITAIDFLTISSSSMTLFIYCELLMPPILQYLFIGFIFNFSISLSIFCRKSFTDEAISTHFSYWRFSHNRLSIGTFDRLSSTDSTFRFTFRLTTFFMYFKQSGSPAAIIASRSLFKLFLKSFIKRSTCLTTSGISVVSELSL
ncbi:hypothetical protein ALC56_08693 [Trachymyrmex septentrionalis]|uniref:Uncharacterized protein n=1 Tax=Trachymyrmex septentrionalis TaxID=34720 RepID=A0A195F9L3_9HYME|nr:hypothetical protein ALC56_08693 [Trachymyrmex septentrionalis]